MLKTKLSTLLFIVLAGFSACKSTQKNAGCAADQTCTAEFVSFAVEFVDKDGNNVVVKDITAINQRTKLAVVAKNVIDPGFAPNLHTIATDSNKSEFSVAGDDVTVTATSVATNKTASATFKISGGCNCHIAKLSGSNKIVFE